MLLVGLEDPFTCCHMLCNPTKQCLSWACNSLLATPEVPCLLWKVRIHYICTSLQVVSTLNQINPGHIIKWISVISTALLSTHLHLNVQVFSSLQAYKTKFCKQFSVSFLCSSFIFDVCDRDLQIVIDPLSILQRTDEWSWGTGGLWTTRGELKHLGKKPVPLPLCALNTFHMDCPGIKPGPAR